MAVTTQPRIETGDGLRLGLTNTGVLSFLAVLAIAFAAVTLTGNQNLIQNNEERMSGYVRDILDNGHWLCPHNAYGEVMSKPPLFAWLAALAAMLRGEVTPGTLYFPSVLGTLLLSWVLFHAGRTQFSYTAGFFSGWTFLLSYGAIRQMYNARYDGLFAMTVAAAAICAFQAWNRGRGWQWFWIACAVATMVKGPLGIILAGGGLLAAFWEKRTGHAAPIRGSHFAGIALFLLVVGGWIALAMWQFGHEVTDKLISQELVGHAMEGEAEGRSLAGFFEPSLAFVTMYLPWSLLTLLGLWRVWRHPAAETSERRFERFLTCWLLLGLLLFSLGAHQRGRHVLPLIPAGALLAGREAARLLSKQKRTLALATAGGVTLIALGGLTIYIHLLRSQSRSVIRTAGLHQFADRLRSEFGLQEQMLHVDSPFAFQYYSHRTNAPTSFREAAARLRGDQTVYVAVHSLTRLEEELESGATPPRVVARWPESGKPMVQIVSNQQRAQGFE